MKNWLAAASSWQRPLRALVIGHWFLNRLNQEKLDHLAEQPDLDLMALAPRRWRGSLGEVYRGPGDRARAWRLRRGQTCLEGGINLNLHLYLGGLTLALREQRPHVVQVDEEPYCPVSFQVALLKRVFGYRMVTFTYQNVRKRYPVPFSWMESYVLRRTDLLVAGNAEAGEVFAAKGYRGPVEVVPHGMNVGRYRDAPPADRGDLAPGFTVGFVGRLEEEKGLLVLLEAIERMVDPPVLLLVGSGPLAPRVREWIAAPVRAGRARLIEGVPHHEVPRWLKLVDALAVPSISRPGWKEQLGRVILEGMAAGVPVVASDSGEIRRTLGGAGLLVPERDPAALAAALERLRADPELVRDLVRRGGERAAEFGWDRVARRLAELWRDLVSGGAGGLPA